MAKRKSREVIWGAFDKAEYRRRVDALGWDWSDCRVYGHLANGGDKISPRTFENWAKDEEKGGTRPKGEDLSYLANMFNKYDPPCTPLDLLEKEYLD